MSDTERMANALERIVVLLEQLADERDIDRATAQVGGPGQPAVAPFVAASPIPTPPTSVCPVHGTPWRTSKKDGTPSKRGYCSGKLADGSYCREQGPWLG